MKHYLILILLVFSLFSFHAIAKDEDYIGYYDNGEKKMAGTLRDGLKHGKWEFWDSEGNKTLAVHYSEGDKHGLLTQWNYHSKEVITCEYYHDQRHGKFRSETIDSKAPIAYGNFENNEKEGEWFFAPTRYRKTEEIKQYKQGVAQ